jgi:hypothetical protein
MGTMMTAGNQASQERNEDMTTTPKPAPKARKTANVHWVDLPTGRTIRTSQNRIYSHCTVMNLHANDDGSLRQEVLSWHRDYTLATKAVSQLSQTYVAGRTIVRNLMPDGSVPVYRQGWPAEAAERSFTVAAVFTIPCQVVLRPDLQAKRDTEDAATKTAADAFVARNTADLARPITKTFSHTDHGQTFTADAYTSDGKVWRWKSNDAVVPLDAAKDYGIPVDWAAQAKARADEVDAVVKAYREANQGEVSDEQRSEMRAAFGAGTTVVNVITGRRTRV